MSSTSATSPITFSNFTGVDFNQIIQSITAASQVPITALQNQLTGVNTAISTLGTISGDFTSLQTALTALNTSVTIPPVGATVSDGAPFTASVLGSPVAGTYSVSVNQLASAETIASQGYASDSDTVGTGTIGITLGGISHSVTINSANDTLDGVASAITSANIGVSAQVVNTGLPGAPYRLEITSNATGAAQEFSVTNSLSGGTAPDFTDNEIGPVASSITGTSSATVGGTYTGNLTQEYDFSVTSGGTVGTDPITITYTSASGEQGTLSVPTGYTPGSSITGPDGLTISLASGTLNTSDSFSVGTFVPQVSSAEDAQVQVGNQIVSSPTNQVTNAIPGVMLSLSNTGGPSTVSVAQDETAQGNQINTFVSAYNTLLNDINSNTQAVPNQTAPPLADDGGLREVLFTLQMQLGTLNLADLGISVDQHTGQLSFSQSSFASAESSDPSAVNSALSSLYDAINPSVSFALAPNTGLIATETSSDQQQVTNLNSQISTLQNQLTQQTEQLQEQYAQLQATISSYQSMSELFTDSSSSDSSSSSSGSSTIPGTNLTMSA
jgi:flagellar hook-associated protein 2